MEERRRDHVQQSAAGQADSGEREIRLSDHFTYRKLLRFTWPSVAMMIFTSIYGVVDGFFVSNFAGDLPFKAVNLIMPFLMILGTVGFMFGTGGTAIVAHTYGVGDRQAANRYFSLFVYVTLGISAVLAVLGLLFLRPIAGLLGARGELLEHCVTYGRIILTTLPFLVLQFLFQSFLVAAEKPRLGLLVTVAAGVTNMVLDALLVLLLPQPYKLAGAAAATAMSQLVGGAVPLIYFWRENDSLLRLGPTRLEGRILRKACVNGSSEFMSNVSMNLVAILYNLQLLRFAGEDGVAAYGVMMYVSMIFNAAFLGYTVGVAPVVSYHNGAANHREKQSLLRRSAVIIGLCGLLMLLSAELLAGPLAGLFVGYSPALSAMTVHGLRIYAAAFPLMGVSIFGSGFFTALNDGLTSALISFLRTLVFQTGAVLVLPLVFGLDGIWLSVVAAELFSVVITLLFLAAKRQKYHY